ncbi:hypothetical protein M9Y10_011412 [Tritrichomonas musculus]|uniref:Uncharacterized protein n=1 Tax=Tritrichomonas musculus TaxID=1915356 RepID=A0ABR2IJE5_9EUKA
MYPRTQATIRRKKSTKKKISKSGAVIQMKEMNDRSSKYQPKSYSRSSESDAILDMIDQRIGGLLLRSSELEAKLDAIEQSANKNAAPNYARVIYKTIKSNDNQPTIAVTTQLKEESAKISNSSIQPSLLSTTKTTITSGENLSFNSQNPTEISSLYKIVEQLLKEVREMKNQQIVMSQQVNSMHHQLIQQKLHSDLD